MDKEILQVGNIVFGPNPAKVEAVKARVRVVKQGTPEHDAIDCQRRHEIALLRLLAVKHPRIVRELVDVLVK